MLITIVWIERQEIDFEKEFIPKKKIMNIIVHTLVTGIGFYLFYT
jgi:hypothetical protein